VKISRSPVKAHLVLTGWAPALRSAGTHRPSERARCPLGGRRPGRHAWGARPGRQRRGHQLGAVGM